MPNPSNFDHIDNLPECDVQIGLNEEAQEYLKTLNLNKGSRNRMGLSFDIQRIKAQTFQ